MCPRKAAAIIAFCAASMPLLSAEPQIGGYGAPELVDLYVELALRVEEGFGFATNGRLTKWRDDRPVRVLVFPTDSMFDRGDRYRIVIDATKQVVDHIAAFIPRPEVKTFDADDMTAFVMSSPPSIEAFDNAIAVYIGSRLELVSRMEKVASLYANTRPFYDSVRRLEIRGGTVCFGLWRTAEGDPNTATGAMVFVEDGYDFRLEECLYEEVMQVFGLPNDLPAGTRSMFNDDNVFNRPTDIDWVLWQTHFDHRLKAGMSEEEVRRAAREVIADVLTTIERADGSTK